MPQSTVKCSNSETHKTNHIQQTDQAPEADGSETLTPCSLDNEIQSLAKALHKEKDDERQQNILRRGYNFDSVTDSEDDDLYEISSECTLPDNLSEELLEERKAFDDSDIAENRPDINVAKMLGNVTDLGSTLKFSVTEPSISVSQNTTAKEDVEAVKNKELDKDNKITEDFKILSDLTLSDSDDGLADIEEIIEYNESKILAVKTRTPNELDLDLTGIDSESTDDEIENNKNSTKQAVSEDRSKTWFELLKNEDNNMSRALLLAESGYLEDKITGQR